MTKFIKGIFGAGSALALMSVAVVVALFIAATIAGARSDNNG